MLRRSVVILSLGVIASIGATAAVSAANFPDRPIRVIVSVPAGGGVDTITRIVTDRMRPALGQPLIVENKAGVSGSISGSVTLGSLSLAQGTIALNLLSNSGTDEKEQRHLSVTSTGINTETFTLAAAPAANTPMVVYDQAGNIVTPDEYDAPDGSTTTFTITSDTLPTMVTSFVISPMSPSLVSQSRQSWALTRRCERRTANRSTEISFRSA